VTGSIRASASSSSAVLASAFARNSTSWAALMVCLAPKNVSCAPRNRRHRASSTPRGAAPAAFHQVPVRAGRRSPVGRGGQRLGLGDQLLLDLASALALPVLLRELGLATARVGRPGGGEAVPERVVGRPVQPGQRLPVLQQRPEPVDAAAPVVPRGQRLGLGDRELLLGPHLVLLAGLLRPLGRARLVDDRVQRLEAGQQGVEVADRVRVGHGVPYGPDRAGRVVGRQRS
jgi:hypothetical protein